MKFFKAKLKEVTTMEKNMSLIRAALLELAINATKLAHAIEPEAKESKDGDTTKTDSKKRGRPKKEEKEPEEKEAPVLEPETTPLKDDQSEIDIADLKNKKQAEESEDAVSLDDLDLPAEEKKKVTPEELRKAVIEYAAVNSKQKAYDLLAKYGAKKVIEVKESDFDALMADMKDEF